MSKQVSIFSLSWSFKASSVETAILPGVAALAR